MGNSELNAHFKEYPSNATYLSANIQNELITLIGKEILLSIFSEVKDASCFVVIAKWEAPNLMRISKSRVSF